MNVRDTPLADGPAPVVRFTIDPDGIVRLGNDCPPEDRAELYDIRPPATLEPDALREAIACCPALVSVITGFAAARQSVIDGDPVAWVGTLAAPAQEELRAIITDWIESPWDWATDGNALAAERFAIAAAVRIVRDVMDFWTRDTLLLSLVTGRFEHDQRQAAHCGMSADEANARAVARDLPYRFTPRFPARFGPELAAEDRKGMQRAERVLSLEFAKLTFLLTGKGYFHHTHAIRNHIALQVREALIDVRQLVRYHLQHGTPPRATVAASAQAALLLCRRHASFAHEAIPELEWLVQAAERSQDPSVTGG